MVSSGCFYRAALHKRCCRRGDESYLLCRGCTQANAARGWQLALPHCPCPTEALLVEQLPELLMLQLLRSPGIGMLPGLGCSCGHTGHCAPRSVLGR